MLETDFLPAEERGSRWLIIVLHGLGDSMEGYRRFPQMLRMPQLNYLLVNAPDRYYEGYSWYDFALDPGPGVRRSYAALSALLNEQRRRGFDSETTFLFGFSQGCLMAIETGLRYPHRFAGLIGISGYVHEPDRLLRELSPVAWEQRLLLSHGTRDPLIPIDRVRPQVRLLQEAGLKIEWHEFAKEHTIAGEHELRVIRQFIQRCLESSGEKEP